MQILELVEGDTFVVPDEIDGRKVWVFDTQTGRMLKPNTVIRAEQKTTLRVVPAVAGG